MTAKPPKPAIQHTIEQYEAFRPIAKLIGLFSKDLGRKLVKLDREVEKVRGILKDRDLFAKIYGPLGWAAYDRFSTTIMARVVEMTVHDGETALTEYHLDSDNLRFLGHQFNTSHYRAWHDLYERAVERAGAQDYLSAIPLVLSIIDGVCTITSGKHPFSGGTDAPVFDSETSGPGGLAEGLALLGSTRRRLDVQPIEIPFRHGIIHGLNPNYGHPIVAAKAFNLLQAAVDYFNRRRDEAERLEKAAEEQKPVDLRELGSSLRRNAEVKRTLDVWQARPTVANASLAHSSNSATLDTDTPEAFAADYLKLLIEKNYGKLAYMTADCPNRSISYRAGRLREELEEVTLTEWTITGVEDIAAAVSKVTVTLIGMIDGESWKSEQSMRLMFADENFDAVVRGQPDGRWTVMPDFLSGLWISQHRAAKSSGL